MATRHLMLEGEVDPRDEQIEQLRRAVAEATESLWREQQKNRMIETGIRELRHDLTPLYRVLQKIFGDIDAMQLDEQEQVATARASSNGVDPRWESWKSKMRGRPAEFIDLLLLHKSMSRKQLMAAAHCGKDVVRVTISKLSVAGLIEKNGDRYSLKQL